MTTEFQLIDRFLKPFARSGAGMVLGPGDDCAVLRVSGGSELCVTTDAIVEGVHFDPKLFSPEDIGHKALAVNLSDIAAMGASPTWFVCSIACRPEDSERIPGIAKGMAALAKKSGIALAGGNFTRAEALSIHITAAGELPKGTALTRSGARPGDRVYVTGTLGDAALGLAMRSIGRDIRPLASRQLRPVPRLKAGSLARSWAGAAIDISDGLLQDLTHVLEASGVSASVDAKLIPLSRAFKDAAANLDLALTGGEDYELALFVPKAKAKGFEAAFRAAREPVSAIGEVGEGKGLTILNAPHLATWGYDHFGGERGPSKRRRSAN